MIALKQRSLPHSFAVDAFRAGRSSDALAALRGHANPASRFLAARAALRLKRPHIALLELAALDEATLLTAGRAEYALLRAEALTASSRFIEAQQALALARVHAFGASSAALEADVQLAHVRWAFAGNDFTSASDAAHAALALTPAALDRGDYFVPLEHSRARALHTLGVVAATEGRYGAQLTMLRAALAEMRRSNVRDDWTLANLLMNLSFYVRDFDLEDDARVLRREMQTAWPEDLNVARFYISRSLGWSSALRGNHIGAFREFRAAAEIAPTTALKIWALADRAYLGRELGEHTLARDELEGAADLACRIDWNTIVGDDRAALLHLAKQTAAVAPARARALFDTYRRIKSTLAHDILNRVDRRLRAHESFTAGVIARAENAVRPAREKLCDAFEIWNAIGYRWQAATAALELAEIGGEARYLAYAAAEATARPNSWLARRIAAVVP